MLGKIRDFNSDCSLIDEIKVSQYVIGFIHYLEIQHLNVYTNLVSGLR